MVGRLPALKYFEAASSYACHTSSVGWRQDTSACVCTSIAIKSFVFITCVLWSSGACLIPIAERTPLGGQPGEQRCRLPMHGTEHIPILDHTVENGLQAGDIRIEQRAAAIPR